MLVNKIDMVGYNEVTFRQIEKEYRALLDQVPSPDAIREWRNGVLMEGVPTAPAWVDVLERGEDGVWVRVVERGAVSDAS